MFSNAKILPVSADEMNSVFDKYQINKYTNQFTFGNINTKPMLVFIFFIVGLIALYLIWRVLIR